MQERFWRSPSRARASFIMPDTLNVTSSPRTHGNIEFDIVEYYHRILEKDEVS
ncbi:translation initiation factor eIF-2B subunit alpha [Puccinia graminis f. sp. tritici]|uniref:Translation initiation factor eIF-2B subunit alpha n=1 Tax=Puccinia graminis f. sp. tritici TaxID=56615 RepID=A0A5B0RZK8_PUCGR|nr:translation initiation factor eIF-2B subunit alpha [Puccinia graminis f. sp. tritici]